MSGGQVEGNDTCILNEHFSVIIGTSICWIIRLIKAFLGLLKLVTFGMEKGSSSQVNDNEKGKSRDRRIWTRKEEDNLVDALMELTIKGGMRCDNGTFKPGYLTMIENALAITCPNSGLKAHPHIESKIKTIKRQYTLVVDMLGNSGFGWNETLKCVDCPEDNVWETYLKRVPDVKGFRNKPFPHYEYLALIFGKDRANGKGAETAADYVEKLDDLLAQDNDEKMKGQDDLDLLMTRPPSNKASDSKNPRKRTKSDGWNSGLQEMAQQFGCFLQDNKEQMAVLASRIGQTRDMAEQRATVMDELKKLDHLGIRDRLKVAHEIAHDQDSVNLFFRMDMDEKVEYVAMVLRGDLRNGASG